MRSFVNSPHYGWVMVVVAAMAMMATMPGRTHGLGAITERVLVDPKFANAETRKLDPQAVAADYARRTAPKTAGTAKDSKTSKDAKGAPESAARSEELLYLSRGDYSLINFWATLLGGLLCLPCGMLIDRFGLRISLTLTVIGLAAAVLWMTVLSGRTELFLALLATRAFGQSALSVISITMVAKWFRDKLSLPMAVYTIIMSVGIGWTMGLAGQYKDGDWRIVWTGIGWTLLAVMLPVSLFLTREPPASVTQTQAADDGRNAIGYTLWQAMLTPAFWVFGLAISLVGLMSSGVSLFNESVLSRQGFDARIYYQLMQYTPMIALAFKLPVGWLATRVPLNRMWAAGMLLMAVAQVCFPYIRTLEQLWAYTAVMGLSGSITMLMFFSTWGEAYGKPHLGSIQSVTQMMTVLASALGPVVLARCLELFGSYAAVFQGVGAIALLLGIASILVRVPKPEDVVNFTPEPAQELAVAQG